jgi:hypothetical protein
MHWSVLPRFEWVLFDGAIIGFLVWQLVSVRRLIRIDREQARAAAAARDASTAASPEALPDHATRPYSR